MSNKNQRTVGSMSNNATRTNKKGNTNVAKSEQVEATATTTEAVADPDPNPTEQEEENENELAELEMTAADEIKPEHDDSMLLEIVAEVLADNPGRGRPVDPTSDRQKRLATQKKGKRGRPVEPDSERQIRLAELEAKRAEGVLKKGRPLDPTSERQQRLMARALKKTVTQIILGAKVESDHEQLKEFTDLHVVDVQGKDVILQNGDEPRKIKCPVGLLRLKSKVEELVPAEPIEAIQEVENTVEPSQE